jgi:hypothetical protein
MVWWGVAGDLGRKVDTPSLAEGLGFGLNKGINYCVIYAGGTKKNDEISGSVVAVQTVGPYILMH